MNFKRKIYTSDIHLFALFFFPRLVSEQQVLFAFSGYEMAHLSEMTAHDKQNTAFSVFGRNKTVSNDMCET